jgi:hypothetical protein
LVCVFAHNPICRKSRNFTHFGQNLFGHVNSCLYLPRLRGAEVKVVLFVPVVSGSNPRRLWRYEISDALNVFIGICCHPIGGTGDWEKIVS